MPAKSQLYYHSRAIVLKLQDFKNLNMIQKASPAMTPENPLWTPSAQTRENALITKFMQGLPVQDYQSLWQWSVDNSEAFWERVWDFAGIIGEKGDVVLSQPDKMIGGQFFPNGKINYAENMLKKRDGDTAIIFRDEKGGERSLTFQELYEQVSLWQQALKKAGVGKGDRVAGFMPNMPETIIACLATASLGAIWSSASPDFGVQGVIDRFGQIEPKVLVSVDGYYYGGKTLDCLSKLKEIIPQLKNLKQTIVVPFVHKTPDAKSVGAVTSDEALKEFKAGEVSFERVAFNHPLFIMFSSGTTGVPKCIVHGHGGTLIQHVKEHLLQCDIKPGDKVFYFTTCGWMMWNWLITALASEATLLLFDGSPFYPDGNVLWDYAQKHGCTLFGTSAKYIDAMKVNNVHPMDTHDLKTVRTMTSTGSPLMHESFDFVYQHIKKDMHLASIYGGTDIICASFGIGNPISPVYRGEIQGVGLGTDVDIFDDNGKPIPPGGGAGELVCKQPIPSMPVGFWNDEDGAKYRKAYFEMFPGVWHHGDWVEKTLHNGLIIHGRSDATLNPGGVRIGTAEIYRQVEQVDAVKESIAVGQDFDGDVRVILFVTLKDGVALNDDIIKDIKTKIRNGASPRHVPAKVIQVIDIPRTKSGKITELAVRDVIMGRKIKNIEALANPEALDLYKDLPELQK